MLDRLRTELEARSKKHNELVEQYESKKTQRNQLQDELLAIEKEIIHNQGAMEAIDKIGSAIIEEQEAEKVDVEIVE